MAFADSNGLTAADIAAVTGNNGFGGFGGDGAWWLIILLLFFNNGGRWGGNGAGAVESDVQRGFDQASVMNSLNGIEAGMNANQNALIQQLFNLAMSMQNCCCENRAATADVKYAIATEAAATRASGLENTQKIMDKLCQLELDGVRQNYENRIAGMQAQINALSNQLNEAGRAASQNAQTAQILADNAAQTLALEQYLNPVPIPSYIVQNPNCCTYRNNFFGNAS